MKLCDLEFFLQRNYGQLRAAALILVSCALLAFIPTRLNEKQKAELVLCLDLSENTNGLLLDIRDNLWDIVNNLRKAVPETEWRIGIIGYGRATFDQDNNYIKVLCELTEDYDFVSNLLFRLESNAEKVKPCNGSALQIALYGMNWSTSDAVKKAIYLFGNGNVDWCGINSSKVYEMAARQNIMVNTVYCIKTKVMKSEIRSWQGITSQAGGNAFVYEISNRKTPRHFSQDTQWLIDANRQLNETYMYYGSKGKQRYELMLLADENAKKRKEQFFYSRCWYKLSEHYQRQCNKWDLVSLLQTDSIEFEKIQFHDLPKEYQLWNLQLLNKAVQSKMEERERIMDLIKRKFESGKLNEEFMNSMDSIFKVY